jgi:hypothetical protein
MSTITKDGVLFNMFDVSIQQQEVSTAMYKLLDKIKFEKIEASYGSGALGTNYAEFMNVYQISKNPIEASLATPAGKALNKALDGKFKPVDIVITEHKVKLFWIKKLIMGNKIKIKRENNQGVVILKVLSLFRDKDLIKSLQEVSEFMKKYEKEDEVTINCDSQNIDEIKSSLEEENIKYIIL